MSRRGVMISEALVSSNSKMLWINFFSSSLISPSSSTTSTKVINSSSVAVGECWMRPVSLGMKLSTQIRGAKRAMDQRMKKIVPRATITLLRVARDLGRTSPNTRISRVMTPVATPSA